MTNLKGILKIKLSSTAKHETDEATNNCVYAEFHRLPAGDRGRGPRHLDPGQRGVKV